MIKCTFFLVPTLVTETCWYAETKATSSMTLVGSIDGHLLERIE